MMKDRNSEMETLGCLTLSWLGPNVLCDFEKALLSSGPWFQDMLCGSQIHLQGRSAWMVEDSTCPTLGQTWDKISGEPAVSSGAGAE